MSPFQEQKIPVGARLVLSAVNQKTDVDELTRVLGANFCKTHPFEPNLGICALIDYEKMFPGSAVSLFAAFVARALRQEHAKGIVFSDYQHPKPEHSIRSFGFRSGTDMVVLCGIDPDRIEHEPDFWHMQAIGDFLEAIDRTCTTRVTLDQSHSLPAGYPEIKATAA